MTSSNAGEDVEQQEPSSVAGGDVAWRFLTNVKRALPTRSSSRAAWYSAQRVGNFRSHKNLHVDVYTRFVHNHQNLEATEMFVSASMNCGPSNEMLLNAKRNELSNHGNMGGTFDAFNKEPLIKILIARFSLPAAVWRSSISYIFQNYLLFHLKSV